MNALAMLQRCGAQQRGGPLAPEATLPDCLLDRLLRWDGRRLTVDGEPHFAVYVWTPEALAATLMRLGADTTDASDDDVAAVAQLVRLLAGRDLRTPFVIGATAIIGALLHLRLHALEAPR